MMMMMGMYGVVQGCFVCLLVCMCLHVHFYVCVFVVLTMNVCLSGVDVRCSAGGQQGEGMKRSTK